MTLRILCYTLAILLTIAIPLTVGYPGGAPEEACDSMLPDHDGATAQDSDPPYAISLSNTTVQAGETIEVTLTTEPNTKYEGLLLKALPVGEDAGAVGSFILNDDYITMYKTIDCSGLHESAITHSNSEDKNNLTVTWTAPPNNGQFLFFATVVQDADTFWAKFSSDDYVEVVGGSDTTVSPPTTVTTTTTASPHLDYDYSQCGSNRSCMGNSPDCISNKDCSVLLTYHPTPNDNNSISLELIRNSGGYVAMGLSEDKQMGDDSVLQCMSTSPDATISASINQGRSNLLEGDDPEYFTPGSSSFIDGVLKCNVQRNMQTTVGEITTDLKKKYFILLAVGPLNGDGTDISKHTDRWSSSSAVDLSSEDFIIIGGGDVSLPIEIIMHGSLMVVAWVITASVAVFLARFYKDMWPDTLHCGVKIWFAWHRGLNLANVVVTIAALIIIFVYTGTTTAFATNAHPSMGIVTIILMLMQPIGAIFRPMPGTPNRKIFNWLHFTGGMLACCCGVITIYLAVTLKSSHLETYFYYIVSGFVAFYILMFGCMEFLIHKHLPKVSEKQEIAMKENITNDVPSPDVQAVLKTKRKIHYKEVLLGIFCCGVIGFAIAMIVTIAMG